MGYGQGRGSTGEIAGNRTVVVASADADFRNRLHKVLTEMRWEVREAEGGAQAMEQLETAGAEAMLVDHWLPDLEVSEFTSQMRSRHPAMDLLRIDDAGGDAGARSPRRNELLQALREARQERSGGRTDAAAWMGAPIAVPRSSAADRLAPSDDRGVAKLELAEHLRSRKLEGGIPRTARAAGLNTASGDVPEDTTTVKQNAHGAGLLQWAPDVPQAPARGNSAALPNIIGQSPGMMELARLVRLVAPRTATVLIEGATGTGKELVAKAVHSLSTRASKPFVVLNCAAIPEALLEAELFGHTRGAFTGAVQSRTGRVEAANGGTLFLDEIGEMPLALQAKMLRFLECGEIQRVGGNETVRVDVRVVAATHQPLKARTAERAFRLDLYHRLAVFPIAVPSLAERMEDLVPLATFLLGKMGEEMPVKRLSVAATERLLAYDWPGNVRELAHVLERACILAEDRLEIAAGDIQL